MTETIEELINENKNFIYKIASKYSKYYSIEDLFQVGTIGFIKAYKKYKSVGVKFTTYAYKYVLGEIIEYIRNDRTMKVSSDILKLYKSYEKTKDFLVQKLNRMPTFYEISSFMNIDESYLSEVIEKSEFAVSLESNLNDDNFTLENILGIDERKNIDDLLDLKKELSLMPKKGTSKTIVINEQKNNYFYGDDTLEIRLSELKQVVAKVESQIRLIKNALSKIGNDEYYEIITKYYFDRCTLEELAEYFDTSNVTIIKHKKALINELKVYLFPSEFISEL